MSFRLSSDGRVREEAARLGLGVDISRPGDGKTRFVFYLRNMQTERGRDVGHCVGKREATLFLIGFEEGQRQILALGSKGRAW